MTDRELLQMALNALERYKSPDSTIKALRARLAQPEHPDAQGSPCPKFWDWLPKAYGQTESFSKYNMEVAYLEGKKAQSERAECDGGQCGIGGYCKQCPKTQPEPEPVAWFTEDHRAVVLLRKAALYDQMMSKRGQIKPVTNNGPRPAKPGAAGRVSNNTEAMRAQQRLAKTGRVDDAADAIFKLLK